MTQKAQTTQTTQTAQTAHHYLCHWPKIGQQRDLCAPMKLLLISRRFPTCERCLETVARGTFKGGGIYSLEKLCPPLALFFGGAFNVVISRIQYQNASSVSLCVTGLVLKGAVALITSLREVRRRSSFEERAHPVPYKGPPNRCRWLPGCFGVERSQQREYHVGHAGRPCRSDPLAASTRPRSSLSSIAANPSCHSLERARQPSTPTMIMIAARNTDNDTQRSPSSS